MGLCEEEARILAETPKLGGGFSRCEDRYGEVDTFGVNPNEQEEVMVQPKTKRKERNRKLRWRAKREEYCEDQVQGTSEMEETQTQSWRHREQVGAQYQGGGLYEEAELFLADCARSATVRSE